MHAEPHKCMLPCNLADLGFREQVGVTWAIRSDIALNLASSKNVLARVESRTSPITLSFASGPMLTSVCLATDPVLNRWLVLS